MIWKPHATVAAIIEKEGRFLMVEEEIDGLIVYNQPAGHLEPDETLYDAVIRETDEEAAWEFLPKHITGMYLWKQDNHDRTFLRLAFCGKCQHHKPEQKLDSDITRALWMSRDDIINKQSQLRSPLVLRCIDDYLAGCRYPLDMLINI